MKSRMTARPILNLRATLSLNEKEIRLLHTLSSFGGNLTSALLRHVTPRLDEDFTNDFFKMIRAETERLIACMDKAREAWDGEATKQTKGIVLDEDGAS